MLEIARKDDCREALVTVGVDTHLDEHVAVALDFEGLGAGGKAKSSTRPSSREAEQPHPRTAS